jgi:V8-like Glu-specific endopeptidase
VTEKNPRKAWARWALALGCAWATLEWAGSAGAQTPGGYIEGTAVRVSDRAVPANAGVPEPVPADGVCIPCQPHLVKLAQPMPFPGPGATTDPRDGRPVVYDARTGRTTVLPLGEAPPPRDEDRVAGSVPRDDAHEPPLTRNFGALQLISPPSYFPAQANVKVFMTFLNTNNQPTYWVCSGTLIDARTVLTAGHCVYTHEAGLISTWATSITIVPAYDNGAQPFGSANMTQLYSWTNWTNSGDLSYDMGEITLDRPVGAITGWFGYGYNTGCGWFTGNTFNNFSYPAEGAYNGQYMYYHAGTFDSCPFTNRSRYNLAGWGGMSGSSAYWYDGSGGRYAYNVASTSDRATFTEHCNMWQGNFDYIGGTVIPSVTPGSPDFWPLWCRGGPSPVHAGDRLASNSLYLHNNSSAGYNGSITWTAYLSTNSTISSGDTPIGNYIWSANWGPKGTAFVNIPAGQCPVIPAGTPPGNYYIGVLLTNNSGRSSSGQDAFPIQVLGARPVNDTCAGVIPIGAGTYFGTNTAALTEGDNNCAGSSGDVWYSFQPSCSGSVTMSTCGAGTDFDTVLSAHSGCPGTAANQIVCNDDSCGLQSSITFNVTAGSTYTIRVAGYSTTNSGNFQLNVTPSFNSPSNDNCADATAIGVGTVSGNTACATNDGTASCGLSSGSSDVWYSFRPTCDGAVIAQTCGSSYDTVVSVFTGTCGNLTEVACDDDSGNNGPCPFTLQSWLTWNASAGTRYLLRVSGYNGHSGPYNLNLSYASAPGNDACANAYAITPGTYYGQTCGASRDGGNDACRVATAGDVWYSYVPSCTGTVLIDTCGSNYDTEITLYRGNCGNLIEVACNDDAAAGTCTGTLQSYLTAPVTAGVAYKIRVSGYTTNIGTFVLHVFHQANDFCQFAQTATNGNTAFDTRCATNDLAGGCGLSGASPDVWFSYTATCSGRLIMNLCGSGYDTVVSAYSGTCGDLTELGCNDDAGTARCPSNGFNSYLAVPVVSGTVYYIRVSGYNGASGTGTMNLSCSPCAVDVNHDGQVNVGDFLTFLSLYSAGSLAADMNGDNQVNVQDFLRFLQLYSAGCP